MVGGSPPLDPPLNDDHDDDHQSLFIHEIVSLLHGLPRSSCAILKYCKKLLDYKAKNTETSKFGQQ